MDCGCPLEPPHGVPTIYVLSKNKKKIIFFHLNTIIFTVYKSLHNAWACLRNGFNLHFKLQQADNIRNVLYTIDIKELKSLIIESNFHRHK